MKVPDISVIMSVYNGAGHLRKSIESVLSQEGVDFEFIIINDGSTDDSPAILKDYSDRDSRIRIIHQENMGLTRALMRGCEEAKWRYIARQDCGDISLPGRLAEQKDFLDSGSDAVLVVSGVRQVLQDGRAIVEIWPESDEDRMRKDWQESGMGIPAHGSVMFRRDAYLEVGGYRAPFYYAQDRDLWLRLNRLGALGCIRGIFYELLFDVKSISSSHSGMQAKFSGIADRCSNARSKGQAEEGLLEEARILTADATKSGRESGGKYLKAGTYYRLASVVEKRDCALAREFYRRSLETCPYYWRTWLRAIRSAGGIL